MSETQTQTTRHPEWMESLYERLAEDDEGRVCKATSEEACRQTPGNFFRTLVATGLLGGQAATVSVQATILARGLAGLRGALLGLYWNEVSG